MTYTVVIAETNGIHIGIYCYLRRRDCILHKVLLKNRHNSASVKTRKGIKLIICIREYLVMHLYFIKQMQDASAVKKVIHFINNVIANVCIVFISAGTRCSQVENPIHREP